MKNNWKVKNSSVEISGLSKLEYSEEYPMCSCPVCDQVFNCGHRWLVPYKVLDNDHKDEVVYQCDYDKCEFTIPAEWLINETEEAEELINARCAWSLERLKELGKERPGHNKELRHM